MDATDIIGLLGIVALALVVGLMGGMRLSRWCDRRDKVRGKQAFLHLSNPRFLG